MTKEYISIPAAQDPSGNAGFMPSTVIEASTLTYQNLLFCRVRINSIFGFIIRTYKKVGFGSLRYSTVEARKLEHQYPHGLKVKYRGSQH